MLKTFSRLRPHPDNLHSLLRPISAHLPSKSFPSQFKYSTKNHHQSLTLPPTPLKMPAVRPQPLKPPQARQLTHKQIKQILFDCDNTLVLSESLAFEACAELANEILQKQNIPDRFTGPQLLKEFVGQNFRGMLTGLQTRYNFTLPPNEMENYVQRELGAVIAKLEAKAQPCEGVIPELEKLKKEGKYGMAVVSSSALSRVVASIKKTDMAKYFPVDHVFSAATSLPKPTSKPDPAIYLHACKVIGVEPGECVAIEDSKSGATAAMRAKIPLIGYVGPYLDEGKEHQEKIAKMLREECGATAIMYHWSEFDACLKKVLDS